MTINKVRNKPGHAHTLRFSAEVRRNTWHPPVTGKNGAQVFVLNHSKANPPLSHALEDRKWIEGTTQANQGSLGWQITGPK